MTLVEHIATFLTRNGWNPRVIRAGSRLHKLLFHTLRLGRFRLIGQDSLILTTCGRRSARKTSTPLFYAENEGRLYVAGSFAGSGQPPNWYLNLVANPEVEVETRLVRGRYQARVVSDTEAAALWPKLDAIYPTFARYRQRTVRVIRIVELLPV
ncbi:MAG: nitroreductase family deazaflavin-dependent oxidoreductase [Deltaproteobacteria bacterium]|nr:nitroreductase family deazaflavin-dependent oxidoreductase [Deltaproteobacteria bacterium]